jgi:hypothetical protein
MTSGPSTPEPSAGTTDPAATFAAYLDHFRAETRHLVGDLADDAQRRSTVPSGWTPAELVSHLAHMERRWFVWGFLAEPVPQPWGDHDAAGRWHTDRPVADLLDDLDAVGDRTRAVLASYPLHTPARRGGRFTEGEPPTLLAIAFHVLQEYARHLGHLDIARELHDGTNGEG